MSNQLPKNWIETEFGSIVKLKNGYAFKSKDLGSLGIPIVRIGNIQEGRIDLSKSVKIDHKHIKKDFLVENGDILIAMSGATTGKYGIYENDEIILQNQRVGNLRPHCEKLTNKRFVFYLLGNLKKVIEDLAYGGAQPNISPSLIEGIKIGLPPLSEQNRIVTKLDQLFGQLEVIKTSLDNIPQLLKDFRQQVLTQAVTGKFIRKTEYVTLGNTGINIKTGPFGSALHKSEYIKDGIPVINPSHLKNGTINPDYSVSITKEKAQELNRWILNDNDVILGRRGEMGRCALYKKDLGEMICGTGSVVLEHSKQINPVFLDFYLRSAFCINYLESNSVGSTMINLNQKILNSLPFPDLTYEEQTKSIKHLSDLFAKADIIEKHFEALKEKIDNLPQTILHKAFIGELVPQLDSDGNARDLLEEIIKLKNVKNEN